MFLDNGSSFWTATQIPYNADIVPAETLCVARQTPSEPLPDDPWRQWHRLFGLLLSDHLSGSPFTVELEKDLSQKIQLLDVPCCTCSARRRTR